MTFSGEKGLIALRQRDGKREREGERERVRWDKKNVFFRYPDFIARSHLKAAVGNHHKYAIL